MNLRQQVRLVDATKFVGENFFNDVTHLGGVIAGFGRFHGRDLESLYDVRSGRFRDGTRGGDKKAFRSAAVMRARLVFDEVADDYIELVEVGTRKRFGAVRRRDYFVAQGGQICRQAGTKLIAVIHDQNSASCGHALVITAKCPREELARRGEKDSRFELYDIAPLSVRNILPRLEYLNASKSGVERECCVDWALIVAD